MNWLRTKIVQWLLPEVERQRAARTAPFFPFVPGLKISRRAEAVRRKPNDPTAGEAAA